MPGPAIGSHHDNILNQRKFIMHKFKTKTIIITGDSRGLGYALVKLFLSKKWKVFPLVRKEKDATALKTIRVDCYGGIS